MGTSVSFLRSIGVCSLGAALAAIAGAEPARVLTWQDCVRLAAEQNPDLLSALKDLQSSRAAYYGSYNGILPQLSLQNSFIKRNPTTTGTVGAGGTITTSRETWQAQGTASLEVINVNQWATIRLSKAGYLARQANSRVTSSDVLLALYKAFASVLYSQDQEAVARSIQALWKNNSEMIALRYQSGRESKGNKMRTDAQLLQAQVDVTQAGRDLRAAQQTLSQAIGVDHFEALATTGTWTAGSVPPTPPNFDTLIEGQPRVLAQKAVVAQAKASVQAAYSDLFPSLSVSFNRGFQDTHEFPTSNPYWTFTGLLNYPLFGGGPTATYFNTASANRSLEKTEADLRSVRNQVRSDLESAWAGYLQALDQVNVQQAFLDASRQRRKESDVRYLNGLMAFEEWQIVVNEQVNFEKSFLKSEQNLLLAEAQWRFASGQQLGATL